MCNTIVYLWDYLIFMSVYGQLDLDTLDNFATNILPNCCNVMYIRLSSAFSVIFHIDFLFQPYIPH